MGSEDLFFKRKQDRKSLGRKSKEREPYATVLIVCEGETEFYYLDGLREELQLNKANIPIKLGERGANRVTDPMNIVNDAEKYLKDEEYDKIYCVFDKEQSNYKEALKKLEDLKKKGNSIYAIPSVPYFDYWLLLHFTKALKPYRQKGRKSAGDQIKSELRKYIKNYREGDKNIFKKVQLSEGDWKEAVKKAKQLAVLQQKNGTDNPSTKIYELVDYLLSLKR